jgi:membrane protein DedA with SNARE-associated domain
MKLKDFVLFTLIGSAAWNIILAALGYFLYSQKELLSRYYNELWWTMIVLGAGFVVYLIYKFWKKKE